MDESLFQQESETRNTNQQMRPSDSKKGKVATQKCINVNKVFIDFAALEVSQGTGQSSGRLLVPTPAWTQFGRRSVTAGQLQSTAEVLLSKVPAHQMLK